MPEYVARRQLLINGVLYEPGQVVPGAEQLQNFRALIGAGFLVKAEPADAQPSEEATQQIGAPPAQPQAAEGPPTQPQVEEGTSNDMELQWESSEQSPGRGEVRDRGRSGDGSTPVKRGNTVRVSSIRK